MHGLLWRNVGAVIVAFVAVGASGISAAQSAEAALSGPAAPVPPSVRVFFATPAMSEPVLSPNGLRMAVLVANEKTGRRELVVIELGPPMKAGTVARWTDADVESPRWVNDQRLVYSVSDRKSAAGENLCPGLWAVDHDGGRMLRLIGPTCHDEGRTGNRRELSGRHALRRLLRDGSADVVVLRTNVEDSNYEVRRIVDKTPLRLNTLTGQTTPIAAPGYPPHAKDWVLDGMGRPRMVVAQQAGRVTIHALAGEPATWTPVARFTALLREPGEFYPQYVGPDDEIYGTAPRDDPAQTTALFRFDRRRGALESEPLVGISGFDFDGFPIFDLCQRKLIGVYYRGDAPAQVWFTKEMKQLQAELEKRLPGHAVLLQPADCSSSRWTVVTAFSDRQPSRFLLYDRESGNLQDIGALRPGIDPARMAQRDFVRFEARDGLSIPMHVTRPRGRGPWPTVVLVHDGPWQRGGIWAWSGESQFLASRGYLVLEPEFRGSTGYGDRLKRAGFRQWGLKMQDDIADATRWAIEQRLADADRVCLAGAGYGGYATLIGLLRYADLYRCGVAFAPITDLALLYDSVESTLSEDLRVHGMALLVGDRLKDAVQLENTSPLRQAQRLTRPLMLAHGTSDWAVPIEHSERFRDAVRRTNPRVDWVAYAGEGHSLMKPENRVDFYERFEKFLAEHLSAR
jgi:dienelactone hydrolase